MAKCVECDKEFDVEDARDDYNSEWDGDPDYDEQTGGEWCGPCGISKSQGEMNLGRAILMMNGDEDYDADHVEKYL
jgi:hypothetical protein